MARGEWRQRTARHERLVHAAFEGVAKRLDVVRELLLSDEEASRRKACAHKIQWFCGLAFAMLFLSRAADRGVR